MQARRIAAAFLAGSMFAIGLVLAGMTQPSKVVGFLDVAGDWDPSLAFVMGAAILVFMPLFRLIQRRSAPLCASNFALPTRRDIDGPLLVGASLFGIGWGLAGYCPGPALTSLASGSLPVLTFAAAMLLGFGLKRAWELPKPWRRRRDDKVDSTRQLA